jgi:hypothetical protein
MGSPARVLLAAFACSLTFGCLPWAGAAGHMVGGMDVTGRILSNHAPGRHITRRSSLLRSTESRDMVSPRARLATNALENAAILP